MDGFTSPTAAMMGGASPSPPASPPKPKPIPKPPSEPAAAPPPRRSVLNVTGVRMCLPYSVLVAGDEADRRTIERALDGVFSLTDSTFTPEQYNTDSEAAAINRLEPGKRHEMSAAMAEVLAIVEAAHAVTGGRFDPTVGPLVRVWEAVCNAAMCGDEQSCPKAVDAGRAQTAGLLAGVGWKESFKLDGRHLLKLRPSGLDLSGVAKGWCIDEIVRSLAAAGFGDAYVEWGGDCRAEGVHPEGRPWRVAVAKPPPLAKMFKTWKRRGSAPDAAAPVHGPISEGTSQSSLHSFEVQSGTSLATSGDFGMPWRYGYFGVIRPGDGLMEPRRAGEWDTCLVTVGCSSCACADALATAFLTFDSVDELFRTASQWLSAPDWPPGGVTHLIAASRSGGKKLIRAGPQPRPGGVTQRGPGRDLRAVLRSLPQPVSVIVPGADPGSTATVESLLCLGSSGRTVAVCLQKPSRLQLALSQPPASFNALFMHDGGAAAADRCAAGGAGASEREAAEAQASAAACTVAAEEPSGDHVLLIAESTADDLRRPKQWLFSAHGPAGRWYRPVRTPTAEAPSPAAFAVRTGSPPLPVQRLQQASTRPEMVMFVVPALNDVARTVLAVDAAGDVYPSQSFHIRPLAGTEVPAALKPLFSGGGSKDTAVSAAGGELECTVARIVRPVLGGAVRPSAVVVLAKVTAAKPPDQLHPDRILVASDGSVCALADAEPHA